MGIHVSNINAYGGELDRIGLHELRRLQNMLVNEAIFMLMLVIHSINVKQKKF